MEKKWIDYEEWKFIKEYEKEREEALKEYWSKYTCVEILNELTTKIEGKDESTN